MEKPKLGVISFHNSKETKSILNCAEKLGFDPVWITEENLSIKMTSDKIQISPDTDVMLNRMLLSKTPYPTELLGICEALRAEKPVLNKPKNVLTVLNKISSTAALSTFPESDIPKTYYNNEEEIKSVIEEREEVIEKRAIGTHGDDIRMIQDGESYIVNSVGKYALVQERVEQEENEKDIRAYVVGDKVVSVMERISPENDWKTNIARGASANEVQLNDSLKSDIISVCQRLGLDYAGVDLMLDEEQKPYFLEVNPTAGFEGLFESTNVNPAPYMIEEAADRIGFSVDRSKVSELSNSLDYSMPSSEFSYSQNKKPKIGLEEKAYVAGQSGVKKVHSRVDTTLKKTFVSLEVASEVNLGPIKGYSNDSTNIDSKDTKRPIVGSSIKIAGNEHNLDVILEERDIMKSDIVLGRDILESYIIHPNIEEDSKESF